MRLSVNTELSLCVRPSLALALPWPCPLASSVTKHGPFRLPSASPPQVAAAGCSQQEHHSSLGLAGRAHVRCEFTLSPLLTNLINSLASARAEQAAEVRESPPHLQPPRKTHSGPPVMGTGRCLHSY